MNQPNFNVQGTDVFVQGHGAQTLVFIHGWPDTLHLWDSAVQALEGQHRCVRFTLPGFDAPALGQTPSLADITARLLAIIDRVSPDQPVTLVLHDWGCIFGYEMAARHPHRVARIVGVDIGDYNAGAYLKSISGKQKLMILAYQLFLTKAWLVGRFVSTSRGNAMTRWMARAMRCPTPSAQVQWYMNFPYAMTWLGIGGGLRSALPVQPHCPMLYVYGQRKPFMFHSPRWLEWCAGTPGSRAVGLPCGHWVMVSQASAFEGLVQDWLTQDSTRRVD